MFVQTCNAIIIGERKNFEGVGNTVLRIATCDRGSSTGRVGTTNLVVRKGQVPGVICVKVDSYLVQSDYSFGFRQAPPDLGHLEGQSLVPIRVRHRMKITDLHPGRMN